MMHPIPPPFPASVIALHGLLRRYGVARRQSGRTLTHALDTSDPLWQWYAAAEAAAEGYDSLITWHINRPTDERSIAISEPLRLILGAIHGVLTGSDDRPASMRSISIGRELLAPAPMAAALIDAVVLLVVDAIQQGAGLVNISTPRAPYPVVQIQSDISPSEPARAAATAAIQGMGTCVIDWDGNAWGTRLEARMVAPVVLP